MENKNSLSSIIALPIVAINGGLLMIMEMIGSRILAPTLGTSIIVWTGLIGIILLFIALGSRFGGILADKHPSRYLLSCLPIITGWFILIDITLSKITHKILIDSNLSIYTSVVIATIILFAIPSFLFGIVTPFVTKLVLINHDKTGTVVGQISAWSTIGSIVGTFAGGFVLVSWFSNNEVLLMSAISLFLLPLLIIPFQKEKRTYLILAIMLTSIVIAIFLRPSRDPNIIQGKYQTIFISEEVLEDGEVIRCLQTHPKRVQSACSLCYPNELILPYTLFFALGPILQPNGKSSLMLGGGAYSVPKWLTHYYPTISMDIVEIDPMITKVAKDLFFLSPFTTNKIFHEDARLFLNKNKKKYDYVFLDVFSAAGDIPFHLTTNETMQLLRKSVNENGVVIINVTASLKGNRHRLFYTIAKNLQNNFATVELFAVQNQENVLQEQNLILVAFPEINSKIQDLIKNKCDIETFTDLTLDDFLKCRIPLVIPENFPVITDEFAPIERFIYF